MQQKQILIFRKKNYFFLSNKVCADYIKIPSITSSLVEHFTELEFTLNLKMLR